MDDLPNAIASATFDTHEWRKDCRRLGPRGYALDVIDGGGWDPAIVDALTAELERLIAEPECGWCEDEGGCERCPRGRRLMSEY